MSNDPKITRSDLIAIAYALYASLCDSFDKPHDDPFGFLANCEKAFDELSNE